MSRHSRFSASSAHRWMNCPGSFELNQGNSGSNLAADQGTVAHWLASEYYNEPHLIEFELDQAYIVIDGLPVQCMEGSDGLIAVDEEMIENVKGYWGFIEEETHLNFEIEKRLDLSESLGVDCGGTADVLSIDYVNKLIKVIDLKYGFLKVEDQDNKQLLIYALGAWESFKGLAGDDWQIETVIYQPRIGNIGRARYSTDDLFAFKNTLTDAINKIQSGDKTLVSSEDGCRWCAVKDVCPKLREASTELINATRTLEVVDPFDLSQEQLAYFYDKLPTIMLWVKAIEAAVYTKALGGEVIPGYKLVNGKLGNRKWVDEKATIELLKDSGLDLFNMTIKSPTDIAAQLKKRKEKLSEDLITRPVGKKELVKLSDKRKPEKTVTDMFEED